MKKTLLLIVLTISTITEAQNTLDKNSINSQILEYLTENGIDPEQNSQLFTNLIDLSENKINIHNITKSFLEQLLFLSDFQIQQLLYFTNNNHPIYSKYQLQGIKDFSPDLIETLSLFVTYGETLKTTPKRYLNANLLFRDSYDLETPAGYSKSDSSGYLGDKHHLYHRSLFEYGSDISCGLVFDKDPGEKIYDNNNIPEFYSGFIQYKSNSVLNKVIIGDFHANFGQGLAMWSGSNIGKAGDIFLIKKRGDGLKKYTSANESNFLRGIATSIKWKSFNLTTFASQKNVDANLTYDSITSKFVATSFPSTGYHRTLNELSKKNNVKRRTFGANLKYRYKNLSLSVGNFYQDLMTTINNDNQLYKKLNPPSNITNNTSIAYNYGNSNFILFGECAINSSFDLATINGILIKPTSNISTSVLYRNLSMKYYSPWINSFTESSNPNGESGLFIGINTLPIQKVEVQGYIDIFKFNWLEYNINKPSSGYELSLKMIYKPNIKTKIYIQYREKEKAKNISDSQKNIYSIENYNLKKVRSNIDFVVNPNLKIQCRFEKTFYRLKSTFNSGSLIYCNVNYHLPRPKLSFFLRYGIFDIDDYSARIYTYENDALYNFSIPSFQDKGSRVYLLNKWLVNENIALWFKIGQTWYSNKKEIGSGLQTIKGNTRTNIKIQLQIKI